jgi:hypothetical protein
MKTKFRFAGLAAIFMAVMGLTSLVTAQTPAIPNTPAGHTLQAWLDSFNSGDRDRIQAYIAKYEPTQNLDAQVGFRNQTGGFELIGIDENDRLHIDFRVKEKAGPTVAVGKIEVKDADPAAIVSFRLRAIPPGMTAADMNMKIDAATRARVIDGAVANLKEFYVYPEEAKKMADALQSKLKSGGYDTVTGAEDFAQMLTTDLQAVSHDKHLRVNFSVSPIPEGADKDKPDAVAVAARRSQLEKMNCSFEKVERLSSNIGYLKFNGFMDPDICAPTVSAAMSFLSHTDALIIDLRENGGGDPAMVAYISSYLFAERTHLNDLYNRRDNKTEQFWTRPDVPGLKLATTPVFVLTAKRTFSGAEEFTYNLKNLKRAIIIGEVTGGGAHPVSGHRIDAHFFIGVPFARAINPITKTDWEGTGVEPDVKVAAAQALDVAQKMATEEINKKAKP